MGREMALIAARQGALLAVSDWNEQGLAETVDLLKGAGVRELRSDVVDVADRAAVAALAEAVVEQFGRVNMMVNNAGVTVTGDFEEMSYEDFDWIVGVNFLGVVNGTKEFLPHLIASGDGALVNISSLFGLMSMPGQTAYNAAKFAVRGFTEALREEMLINGHPVRVTCVHPGGIKTAIARNAGAVDGADQAALAEFFDRKLAKTSPETAAKTIIRAMIGNRPRSVVGLDAKVLDLLVRITGPGYQRLVALAARRAIPAAATTKAAPAADRVNGHAKA